MVVRVTLGTPRVGSSVASSMGLTAPPLARAVGEPTSTNRTSARVPSSGMPLRGRLHGGHEGAALALPGAILREWPGRFNLEFTVNLLGLCALLWPARQLLDGTRHLDRATDVSRHVSNSSADQPVCRNLGSARGARAGSRAGARRRGGTTGPGPAGGSDRATRIPPLSNRNAGAIVARQGCS